MKYAKTARLQRAKQMLRSPIDAPTSQPSLSSAASEISGTSQETSAKCSVSFHPKLFRGHGEARRVRFRLA